MISDFTSGPPVPYNQFVPFDYDISWTIVDYGIFLNVNDKNIINNPSDFTDNIFVCAQGKALDIHIVIPLEQVRPVKDTVSFTIAVCIAFSKKFALANLVSTLRPCSISAPMAYYS
jgi:hypothetical protein